MNINLKDFIPTLYEPSLKKIYKDFPGWQVKPLPIEHMHVVDLYGNPVIISITRHPRINTNCFDGFGVIRNKLDKDEDYPFLAPDPIELVSNICTASNARKTVEPLWINEKKLHEAIKWTFDISKTQEKYSKYIDIINK